MLLKAVCPLFVCFACVQALDYININKNIPELKPLSFENVPDQNITLQNCRVKIIDEEAFKNVVAQEITITYNPLRELKKRTFVNITINKLLLDHNDLRTIEPGTFDDIHPYWGNSEAELSLTYNHLKEIKKGIFSGTDFSILLLSDNDIDFIEAGAFENMRYLIELDLNRNKLRKIGVGIFQNFPKLFLLDLADNEISNADEYAFENSDIELLKMENNNLGYITKEYFKNTDITVLKL